MVADCYADSYAGGSEVCGGENFAVPAKGRDALEKQHSPGSAELNGELPSAELTSAEDRIELVAVPAGVDVRNLGRG